MTASYMHDLFLLCEEVASFLFSLLHLLFTQILPLIALIVSSLFLHLFRLSRSLLSSGGRSPPRKQSARRGRRPAAQSSAISGEEDAEPFSVYEDALPDLGFGGDSSFDLQEEECYEDCEEGDGRLFAAVDEREREAELPLPVRRGGQGGEGEGEGGKADYSNDSEMQGNEAGNRRGQEEVAGGSVQKPCEVDGDEEGKEAGDFWVASLRSPGSLESPSDLPASLDNAIIAAAVNNEGKAAANHKALAPSFSTVAAAMHPRKAAPAVSGRPRPPPHL